MSSTKRDIEKLIREDDWKKALNVNKFEGEHHITSIIPILEKIIFLDNKSQDFRSLRVRLQEQQDIKAQAWKDSFKTIVGIDEEDAEHLNNVSEMKYNMEKQLKEEDSIEIENFRRRSAKNKEDEIAIVSK